MAVVTKTLRSSGGDYSSMITWESTEQTNLVTDGDLHVLAITDDFTSGLNEQVDLNGWTTGASNYITIKAATEADETLGVVNGGFRLYKNNSGSYVLNVAVDYTQLIGFEIYNGGASSGSTKCVQINADHVFLDKMILFVDNGAFGNSNGALRVYDNIGLVVSRSILINSQGPNSASVFDTNSQSSVLSQYRSCIFAVPDGASGTARALYFLGYAFSHHFNNCVLCRFDGSTTFTGDDIYFNGGNPQNLNGDYNACGDASVPGHNSNSITDLTETSADFTDYDNLDFTLASPGSDLYDAGLWIFNSTDIANNHYLTKDIGAFAFVPIVTTKTIKSSGGDYSSLITAESTEQKDLAAAGELMVFDCYDDWASGLAEQVTVAGWTTDNRYYLTIKAADGEGHGGAVDAGFYLKLATNDASALTIQQEYTRAIGLRVRNDNSGGTGIRLFTGCGGSVVEKCIASGGKDGTNNLCGGIRLATTVSEPVHIGNNICWDSRVGIIVDAATTGAWIYNNTCTKNEVYGIQSSVNTAVDAFDLSNNAMHDNANTDYVEPGSLTPTGGNNASEDLTAPGSDPVTGLVDGDFKNFTGNDFGIYTTSDLAGVGASMAWASVEDINSTLRADGVTYDNDDVALLGADTLHYRDM